MTSPPTPYRRQSGTAQHAAVLMFTVHDGGKRTPHPTEERVGEEERKTI